MGVPYPTRPPQRVLDFALLKTPRVDTRLPESVRRNLQAFFFTHFTLFFVSSTHRTTYCLIISRSLTWAPTSFTECGQLILGDGGPNVKRQGCPRFTGLSQGVHGINHGLAPMRGDQSHWKIRGAPYKLLNSNISFYEGQMVYE